MIHLLYCWAVVMLGFFAHNGWVAYIEANSFPPVFECREVGNSYLMGDYELECNEPIPEKYKGCDLVGQSHGPGPGTARINGIKIPVNGWIFVCGDNVVTYDYKLDIESYYPAINNGFTPQTVTPQSEEKK